jgi:molybdopterin synthase catalytic subunit
MGSCTSSPGYKHAERQLDETIVEALGLGVTDGVKERVEEANRRAGTLNVPGIIALSKAISLSVDQREARNQHVLSLRRKLLDGLDARLGDRFRINGPEKEENAVPHILNLTFTDHDGNPVDGEILLMNLDMEGVCASSGSACASGAVEPSHVLQSIGMSREEAQSAIRFSLGKDNTEGSWRSGEEIAREAAERCGSDRVVVLHRVGELDVGETSVAIAVSTPHRAEAYEASRYVIEEIKKRLPVWKREHYVDGERRWVPGRRPTGTEAQPSSPATETEGKGAR